MQDIIIQHYLFVKAFHVISVIAWMAGLLYLPRLFAYHVGAGYDTKACRMLKVMEGRLFKIIMNPAMILTWVFGLLMIYGNPDLFQHGWMHVKVLCVVLLSGLHMMFAKWRKIFASNQNKRSAKFYKIWNEVPAVLMVVIVVMAIAEPF